MRGLSLKSVWALSLAVAAVSFSGAPSALAQDVAARGLDAVGDDPLIQELSRHNLDQLLEYYFQTHDVSVQKQAGVKAMLSIRTLLRSGDKLPSAQRQQIVRQIVAGADTIVPTLQDPRQLQQLAAALITHGMERNANLIEYWGENPRTQAELRPIADLVARVLDLCSQRAREKADKIVAGFGNTPSAQQQQDYSTYDSMAINSHYTRLMSDYYRCLAMDKSDPAREKNALAAIEGLKEYDAPDTTVQPIARLRIGKLLMAAGKYETARTALASIGGSLDSAIQPEPTIAQQYEARYFTAVCDLLAKKADATEAGMRDLAIWEEQNLPADKTLRDGAKASLAMLQYRLEVLKGDLAADAPAKKAQQDKANAVLQQLAKDRPELRGIIFEQLVKAIPEDAPLAGMDTMMLKAIVQQGSSEQLKPEGTAVDSKLIERAIAACREIDKRQSQPGVDAELVDDASIVLPQLLEKLGKNADAARTYLAYVGTSKNAGNRPAAMQNALAAIARLKAADPQSQEVQQLLDLALPLAVSQFGRKDLAMQWGARLQAAGKFAEASAAFRQVPRTDKQSLVARFYELQTMKQGLDAAGPKVDKAAKARQLQDIQKLAQEVRKSAAEARAAASTDADRNRSGLIEANSRLLVARLMRETDPTSAVAQLQGFEESVKDIPGSDDLSAEAMFIRVHALMALGRNTEATQSLLQLLQSKSGDQGAAMIYSLLTKLDADLDIARKAADGERVKSLLEARAALSGPLVDWARSNKQDSIRKATYRYMLYDADTVEQAAMAQSDPAGRVDGLKKALALYDKLLDGDGQKLWREWRQSGGKDVPKAELMYGDVSVLQAKALTLYELGQYKEASSRLGRLLEDRKLGTPRIITIKEGEEVSEDNPRYWEVTYKLYRANVELARDPSTAGREQLMQETKAGLTRLYIREGAGMGGSKWHDEFEKLRAELIPNFKLEAETRPVK